MIIATLLAAVLALAAFAFAVGKRRALQLGSAPGVRLHSLPSHYGAYVLIWAVAPALAVLILWLALETTLIDRLTLAGLPEAALSREAGGVALLLRDVHNLAAGDAVSRTVDPALQEAAQRYLRLRQVASVSLFVVVLGTCLGGIAWARRRISPQLRAIHHVEKVVRALLMAGSTVAIFTTLGIVLSLLFEAARFFRLVSPLEFFLGLEWSPQIALRQDQVGSSGAFGAWPLFAGTFLISAIAMLVAVPVGLFSAFYMSEYASPRARDILKPLLEILAGIPTVVYGFFAALTVAPAVRGFGESLGLDVASESALAAGLVMGIMIIPFISSLSDDVITAVPNGLREASYGLGATHAETIRRVVFPAALPGIVGGVLLALSRAIGETMIVVMAAGMAAKLTVNPLEAVTTVTVQIVSLLVGDQEFDSAKTLAAFALGLVLFIVTLVFNIVALHVVRKYREQYE